MTMYIVYHFLKAAAAACHPLELRSHRLYRVIGFFQSPVESAECTAVAFMSFRQQSLMTALFSEY